MQINHEGLNILVHQIVRTMGCDPAGETADNTLIRVDDDWTIYLPENDPTCVVIGFDHLMNPHAAADIAMRFCKILDMVGVQVMVETEYNKIYGMYDSSSVIVDVPVVQ